MSCSITTFPIFWLRFKFAWSILWMVVATSDWGNNLCNISKKFWPVRPKLLPTNRKRRRRRKEVGDDLGICALNLLPEVYTLPSLVVINLVKVEIWLFKFVTWHHVTTYIKTYVTLWVEAPHGKSPTCHVW